MARQELGELFWRITGDNTQLKKGIGETEKKAKGLSSTFKAVGGAIAAAFAVKKVFDFGKKFIELADKQIQAETRLANVLKSTKNAVGLTADEIKGYASELQGVTTFGDEAILGAQNLLLTFTKIGGEVFPQATETVLNMSTAFGQDLKSSAIQLGKALNDPVQGVTALRRVGVQLTEEQEEQIKVFTKAGEVQKAQAIILGELETQVGGAARAATEGAGSITQFNNIVGDLGEELGTVLIGRVKETNEKLIPMVKKLQESGVAAKTFSFVLSLIDVTLNNTLIPLRALGVIGKAAFLIIEAGAEAAQEKLKPLTKGFEAIRNGVAGAADRVKNLFNKQLEKAGEKIGDLAGDNEKLSEALKTLKDGFTEIGAGTVQSYDKAFKALQDIFDKTKRVGKQGEKAFEGLGDAGTEAAEKIKIDFEKALNTTLDFINAFSGLSDAITDRRIENIDRELQAQLEAAGVAEETEIERLENELAAAEEAGDEETANEKKQELERARLVEAAEKKKADAEYKGRLAGWGMDLAASLVRTALSVSTALSTPPGVPYTIPNGVLAGVLGGIQTATVLAQKPQKPSFDIGSMRVPADMSANIHKDEIILPASLSNQAREEGVTISPAGSAGGGFMARINVIMDNVVTKTGIYDLSRNREITFSAEAVV
jgi:hypothetical protein